MTLDDVVARIKAIAAEVGDDESAHSDEDQLRADVLQAIADGAENPRELAVFALTTSGLEFHRWCA